MTFSLCGSDAVVGDEMKFWPHHDIASSEASLVIVA